MSSDVITSLDKLPRVFTDKLQSLRRRVALWFTVDGLKRLLLAAAGLIAFDLLIDWYFRMDRAQRGIMLVLTVAVLCWVAWRYLIKPLKTKLTDEALVLEMEKHGQFSEELITALEFSRTDWSQQPNVASGLVRQTIDRGMAAGKNVSIDGILRQGKFWTNTFLLALLLLGGLALGVACVKTKTMSTWFNRNVMLGNAAWPQDFYFQVANADGMTLSVPRGDDYVLKASVQEGYRYLPEDVKVEFRSGSGRRLESMDRADDGKAFHHQMMSVTEPITFRLRSKKIASEWYQIELLHRPEIAEIELLSKPPDYTGAEVTALPPGAGPYYVLKGSSLGVRGSADKPLVSAAVVSGENRWPLDIKDEKFAGAVPADQLVSGSFVLEIEDTEQVLQDEETTPRGLGSRDPLRFKLRLKEDETPKIKARLEGVSAMVVSRARLPYTATLSDDFALKDVRLAWQWREDTGEAEETTGDHVPSGVAKALGKATMDLNEAFEIESLDIPAGSRLSLHLMAIDNDIVSGPKVGESTKMIVRVVSEAELRDDLLRREKDQRQLVAEMVDQQDLLLTESQGLLAQTRDVAVLTSEQRSQSVRFEKRQKLLGGGLMPLVGRLRGMVAEIQNNKLEDADGVLQERLRDRIIDPLQALAENELNLASEYLGRVRRAKKAEERRIVFTAAVNNQQIALKRLRAILVHMVKNESYQQAVNLLYEIQKSQDDLRKRTDQEKADLLDKVIRDGESDPEAQPPQQP
jgi:hypothetical protein